MPSEHLIGGSGDGTTDRTTEITAAITAAYNANGGQVVMPRGTFRQNGSIARDFLSHLGHLNLKGSGGDAIWFLDGTGYNRVYLTNGPLAQMEDLTIVGKTTGAEATNTHFAFGSFEQTIVERIQAFGLGCESNEGVFYFTGSNVMVRDSAFLGCSSGPTGAIIKIVVAHAFEGQNLNFFDYGNKGPNGYSKQGGTGKSWITAVLPAGLTNARPHSSFRLVGASFDEGADYGALVDGFNFVEFKNVSINNKGDKWGMKISNAKVLRIEDCWIGYTTLPSDHTAIIAENVEHVIVDALELGDSVKKIELLGTTKKLTMRNSYHKADDGTKTPIQIVNTAGAELDIDGVRTRGGLTQIG